MENPSDLHNASLFEQKPEKPPITAGLFTVRSVPGIRVLEEMLTAFSPCERAWLYGCSIVMGMSAFVLLAMLNISVTTTIPSSGGTLTEGVVGTPRFVNPLLAQSDPDRDLTQLIYSGLMRATPDNHFIKDLASDVTISEDGITYTFIIRTDATFHDGTPVTADDVVFTIAMAQNPDVKSPRRADWEGVTVEAVDVKTVRITLPHPYAPFFENATLGILPKHLWQNVSIAEFPFYQLNANPVGSGPYKMRRVENSHAGTPESYTLAAFSGFTLGKPLLDTITFHFYPNEDELLDALNRGVIDSIAGIAPDNMQRVGVGAHVIRTPLPRIFGVFFNQTKSPALTDASVRKAFSLALDRQSIIGDNLLGYGVAVDGPVLPDSLSGTTTAQKSASPEKANATLESAGWKKGEGGIRAKKNQRLAFSIVTADTPELAGTADAVARAWRALGAEVTVKVFSTSDLTNTVIRPRDYQALLFGEVVGRSRDLFSFWHSSQRNDPGLNLALYANVKADKLLAEARRDSDSQSRSEKTREFVDIINDEHPAVFLYAPEFIYAIPGDLMGVKIGSITTPSERFLNIYEWHRQTERVWDIFIPKEQTIASY